MSKQSTTRRPTVFLSMPPRLALLAAAVALVALSGPASAQRKERLGHEVVEATCATCHLPGTDGAPKIGDVAAWAPRAAQGLSALTEHALHGIRNMPAHGGNPGISDIEIERAIVHMVNHSGGNWVEPIGGATPALLRSSEQVVNAQCARCHRDGLEGAPRIGDRTAWVPRLKKGLDNLVTSAIHGHGGMPARGGLPDLSDAQIRGAIVHMFNYGIPPTPPQAAAPAPNPFHKVVDGTEVYLGLMPAERLRAALAEGRQIGAAKSGIPKGKDVYHVNISLADTKTRVAVTDAEVTVKVSDAAGAETRTLELIAENNSVSYGGFFHVAEGKSYSITAQIRRPGMVQMAEARFDYKTR